jgi:hypothetical protein
MTLEGLMKFLAFPQTLSFGFVLLVFVITFAFLEYTKIPLMIIKSKDLINLHGYIVLPQLYHFRLPCSRSDLSSLLLLPSCPG